MSIICLGFISNTTCIAQDLIDTEKLEEIQTDSDYDYQEALNKSSLWQDFKDWVLLSLKKMFGIEDLTGFWKLIFEIVPYFALLFFLSLLIWYLVRYNTGSQVIRQHDKSKVTLSDDEELLMRQDLDNLIDKAIENEEYRLAIRYMYINCLKRLDMKNIIRYTNEKTNYDYVKEIKYSDITSIFKTLTQSYEQVWYGRLVFDKLYFSKLKDYFSQFHKQLDQTIYAKA